VSPANRGTLPRRGPERPRIHWRATRRCSQLLDYVPLDSCSSQLRGGTRRHYGDHAALKAGRPRVRAKECSTVSPADYYSGIVVEMWPSSRAGASSWGVARPGLFPPLCSSRGNPFSIRSAVRSQVAQGHLPRVLQPCSRFRRGPISASWQITRSPRGGGFHNGGRGRGSRRRPRCHRCPSPVRSRCVPPVLLAAGARCPMAPHDAEGASRGSCSTVDGRSPRAGETREARLADWNPNWAQLNPLRLRSPPLP